MRVLYLLSSLEPAGSETYCISLARAFRGRHEIFWVSDRLHYGQDYVAWPISKKLLPAGFLNIVRAASFVRRRRIDLIHAHSRRANVVAAGASRLAGVPYVTTVHMRMRPHAFNRALPCWGSQAMAICEAVHAHLREAFGLPAERLRLVRNGIDLSYFPLRERDAVPLDAPVTFVGRLSGNRLRTVRFLLSVLEKALPRHPSLRFCFSGPVAPDFRPELERSLDGLNARFGARRAFREPFVRDVRRTLRGSRAVVASGRSALESLASGVPVIAAGEQGCLGLVKPETAEAAARSNFGDFMERRGFSSERMLSEIALLMERPQEAADLAGWGRRFVERQYDLASCAEAVDQVYRLAA